MFQTEKNPQTTKLKKKHWIILLTLDIRKKYKSKNTAILNDDLG